MRVALILLLLVSTAHADESWYKGRYGRNRIVHLSIASGGSLLYIATSPLEKHFAPDPCRWCNTPSIDKRVTDSLVWKNPDSANFASNILAYAVTPAAVTGLVFLGTEPTTASVLDDLIPIAESYTLSRWVSRFAKLGFGRQRPDMSDNESFPSGHTSTAFSVAVSAGTVARMRGYKSQPYVWIVGLGLATTTGYLRIAANKHWFTDTLAGAVVGSAMGLTIPLLMNRQLEFIAAQDHVAVAGVW